LKSPDALLFLTFSFQGREVTRMAVSKKVSRSASGGAETSELWPGIDARFRLIIVAALRSKQLLRGAASRIEADPLRRRNTSVALEEVKRGLIAFSKFDSDEAVREAAE
jgi:DNA-directed RNA polymerase omega subunit